jgi:hypothetical protein
MALAYQDETKPQVGDILFDHTTGREVIVCEVRRAALAVRNSVNRFANHGTHRFRGHAQL